MSIPISFELQPFKYEPDRCQPVISGYLHAQEDQLEIEFKIVQTRDNIKWPDFNQQTQNNQRQDNLWKHTCFELFISSNDTNAYREFNFSPAGQWNSYDFNDYREFKQNSEISSPKITYDKSTPDNRSLSVTLSLQSLMLNNVATKHELQLGITAVIQYSDQGYDYYALTHCGQTPDFHLSNSFIINISCQGGSV